MVLDLCSRFDVGWATSAMHDQQLVTRALEMVVRRRRPDAGLLHHSDKCTQYTSEGFQRALAEHGITCSMSRRGNCYDNAAMKSWLSTLKPELGDGFETTRPRGSNSSTTSRCSTASSEGTRSWVTSAQPSASGQYAP